MTKLKPACFLASLVICALALADTPLYDPTDPSQVAEQSPDGTKDNGLAGPSIDPASLKEGTGGGARGMMAGGSQSVEALLEARCAQCHGVRRQKAGIQVYPVEEIFAGGKEDWVVVPGSPEKSSLLQRIKLPEGHEDIMPPSGPPLTSIEVEQIETWIREGADSKAAKKATNESMAPRGGANRNRGIRPRTWMKGYLSLDLTPEQRSFARKTSQEHQASYRRFQKEFGEEFKSLQDQVRKAARTQDAQLQQLRKRLDAIKQHQPKTQAIQVILWEKLSPAQQSAMKEKLKDLLAKRDRDDARRSQGDKPGKKSTQGDDGKAKSEDKNGSGA